MVKSATEVKIPANGMRQSIILDWNLGKTSESINQMSSNQNQHCSQRVATSLSEGYLQINLK